MASVLDTSLLSFFLPVFVFIFVWAITYGFLIVTKLFGDEAKTLNSVASFCVAIIAVLSGNIVKLVAAITPWIMFIAILLFFIFAIYLFFGAAGEERKATPTAMREIWPLFGQVPIFIIIVIIAVVGISSVFEQTVSPYEINEDGEYVDVDTGELVTYVDADEEKTTTGETIKTLVHPRVLGALFILIVAALVIQEMGRKINT